MMKITELKTDEEIMTMLRACVAGTSASSAMKEVKSCPTQKAMSKPAKELGLVTLNQVAETVTEMKV